MLKIRRSRDRLIFNMGIPILVRWHLYIETAPRTRRVKGAIIFWSVTVDDTGLPADGSHGNQYSYHSHHTNRMIFGFRLIVHRWNYFSTKAYLYVIIAKRTAPYTLPHSQVHDVELTHAMLNWPSRGDNLLATASWPYFIWWRIVYFAPFCEACMGTSLKAHQHLFIWIRFPRERSDWKVLYIYVELGLSWPYIVQGVTSGILYKQVEVNLATNVK